jgi:hypothetical protein
LKFTDEQIAKIMIDQIVEKKVMWRLTQIGENGTYTEPEEEIRKAKMRAMNPEGEDVYANLKFESKELALPAIKNILTERLDEELSYLRRGTKASPTKKMIDDAIRISESSMERNRRRTLRDLGMNDD